jgi:hypothetical protein
MSEPSTKVDADLNANLKLALKAKEDGPLFFALLVKGAGEGRLIVSKRKVPEKQIAEARKAVGSSTLVKGVCFGQDGQLVLETAKAPAPSWVVTVKKQAKEAGLTALDATFRMGRDDESVAESPDEPAEDGAPAAAPPQPQADAAAAWQRRVAGVSDRVKAAAAARHAAARDMVLGVSEAQTLFRRGDTGGAAARLAQVEALLSPAPAAANPAAEYKARLAEWQGDIKAALAAKGPRAADIGKLLAQATALSKPGGDIAQALAKLTECHTLAVPAAPAEHPAEAADTGSDTDEARWLAQRQAIEGRYQKALKEQPANAGRLRAVLAFADGKAEAGEFGKALQGLDSLGKLLQAPTETNPEATAALKQWQAACAEVRDQLLKVQAQIVKAKDVNSDKAVIRLQSVLKRLAFQPSTRQDVVELEGWIRADKVITRVEKPNPWRLPVRVRQRLLPALAALKTQLQE